MAKGQMDPFRVKREKEKLRQERETFDQKKKQDAVIFNLKQIIFYYGLVLLLAVLGVAVFILINHNKFPPQAVYAATGVLFVGTSGLVGFIIRYVLKSKSLSNLEPVTKNRPDEYEGDNYPHDKDEPSGAVPGIDDYRKIIKMNQGKKKEKF